MIIKLIHLYITNKGYVVLPCKLTCCMWWPTMQQKTHIIKQVLFALEVG